MGIHRRSPPPPSAIAPRRRCRRASLWILSRFRRVWFTTSARRRGLIELRRHDEVLNQSIRQRRHHAVCEETTSRRHDASSKHHWLRPHDATSRNPATSARRASNQNKYKNSVAPAVQGTGCGARSNILHRPRCTAESHAGSGASRVALHRRAGGSTRRPMAPSYHCVKALFSLSSLRS